MKELYQAIEENHKRYSARTKVPAAGGLSTRNLKIILGLNLVGWIGIGAYSRLQRKSK